MSYVPESEAIVVIAVIGGVAEVIQKTDGIIVVIRDYDMANIEEAQEIDKDEDGEAYFKTVYE